MNNINRAVRLVTTLYLTLGHLDFEMGRKHFKATDGYEAASLLHFAADHLFSAQQLYLRNDVRCLDSAGYLSCLGIELILKAVLLDGIGEFPDEHDLVKLYAAIRRVQRGFKLSHAYESVIEALNKQQRLRYPDPKGEPSSARGDSDTIVHLVDELLKLMPAKLQFAFESPSQFAKGKRQIIRSHSGG